MTQNSLTKQTHEKADRIASRISTFNRGTDKTTGIRFYLVPGLEPGSAHRATALGCTCDGFVRRAICSHQVGIARAEQQLEAARIAVAQANRVLYGQCCVEGCVFAAVGTSKRCAEHLAALRDQLGI